VFHRACCELAKAGYEVHLIAEGTGTKAYEEKGVIVHPLPECKSRTQRYTRAFQVARIAADLKPDLFHVHEPDLFGPVLAKARKRPVIFDIHESYLDMLNDNKWLPSWIKPFARVAWDQWERQLLRRCAGVVVVTEPIAQRYSSLHRNVHVVANYPDWHSIDGLPPAKRDGKTCVFAGALTRDRGLSEIFKAVALLRRRGVKVNLALAGASISQGYLSSLWEEAARLGIQHQVKYHGVLSKNEATLLQNQASIGLATYLPLPYSVNGLPNKLVECMALGLPVIFSDFPVYREVAGSIGAGIMVDPTKPEEIADAIETLVRNPDLARGMGEAGRTAVQNRFNWKAESKKLLKLYHDLVGPPNGHKLEANMLS
jgi:glycosyltransferase involved in cell wall biosynthesis